MVPVSIKEVHPFSTNKWLEGIPRCGHKRYQLWSRHPENLTVARIENFLNEGLSRFGELPMKALQFSSKLVWGSISNLFNIILMIANMVIIPVVMFYLLRDFDSINKKLLGLVPARFQEKTKDVVLEIDQVLSRFVRGQLMVAGLMGVMYSAGLYLCDTPMSLSLGMMAGLVNLVPYLGLILGLVPSALLTYIHTQEWLPVMGVAGVFAFAQAMEGMLITPRVVGDNIGLHPVAVIFAVLLGGELFGITGMILGVPGVAVPMSSYHEVLCNIKLHRFIPPTSHLA